MKFERIVSGPHDGRWKHVFTTDAAEHVIYSHQRRDPLALWKEIAANATSKIYPILGGYVRVFDMKSTMFAGKDGFLVESGEIPSRAITERGQPVPKFDQYRRTFPK